MQRQYDPENRDGYDRGDDYDYDEYSDLMDDVDRLLEEDAYTGPTERPCVDDATRPYRPVYGQSQEQPYQHEQHYRPSYEQPQQQTYQQPYEQPPVPPTRPSVYAYNADFQPRNSKSPKARRGGRRANQAEFYARSGKKTREKAPKERTRRRHPFLKFLAVLLVIALLVVVLLPKQPKTDQPIGDRKPGVSTILLAGTDVEGLRTDTMILLYLDNRSGEMSMMSLPRDTYTSADMSVPKLNGIYGVAGCGEQGMERLLDYVTQCIGYRPDGYLLVDMNCFEELVETMGGVWFDVPMDMSHTNADGSYQELPAGEQLLDGEDAMFVVRFRSGYALADLQRIQVQRDFLQAAIDQWTSPSKLIHYPMAAKILASNTTTDLSLRNLLWVGKAVMKAGVGDMQMETLPGEAAMISGGSYYVLWPETTAELINSSFNPYQVDVNAEMIYSPWY